MRNSRRRCYGLLPLFLLGALLLQVHAQESVNRLRPRVFDPHKRDPGANVANISAPTVVFVAALGGFRPVAADLLWLKVDQLWDGGAWYRLPSVMESVVQLDPHFQLAWQVYGWHLAYNLNAESVLALDKAHYLDEGTKVLERAVATNPDSAEMTHELAWTLFDRAHNLNKAAEYFYQAAEQPGARSYSARLHYHCYEQSLNFKKLWPAMRYAMSKFKQEHQHQTIVHRSYDFWKGHWNDPMTHRRIIVEENTARQQRSIPYLLYPDNPYWNVCPVCGLPTAKGEPECSACHHYRFQPQQVKPGDASA